MEVLLGAAAATKCRRASLSVLRKSLSGFDLVEAATGPAPAVATSPSSRRPTSIVQDVRLSCPIMVSMDGGKCEAESGVSQATETRHHYLSSSDKISDRLHDLWASDDSHSPSESGRL